MAGYGWIWHYGMGLFIGGAIAAANHYTIVDTLGVNFIVIVVLIGGTAIWNLAANRYTIVKRVKSG